MRTCARTLWVAHRRCRCGDWGFRHIGVRFEILVGTGRFELPTCRLGGDRDLPVYTAHNGSRLCAPRLEILVGTGRFELPTCRLGGDRSIHLSYVPAYCHY